MVKKQETAKPRHAANFFVGLMVLIGAVMVLVVIVTKMVEVLGA